LGSIDTPPTYLIGSLMLPVCAFVEYARQRLLNNTKTKIVFIAILLNVYITGE
jgi:hypothetical protein